MKKIKYFSFALLLGLFSCSAPRLIDSNIYEEMGKIIPIKIDDELIKSIELKEFIKTHKRPKVVLRVPHLSNDVTENENTNVIYNQIEKVFVANDFVVRDRALLNRLLQNDEDDLDYQKIGDQIDTELIIEIVSIDFKYKEKYAVYYLDNSTNEQKACGVKYDIARLECKIIIVEKGQFGGNFTLYTNSLELGKDTYYSKSEEKIYNKPFVKGGSTHIKRTLYKTDEMFFELSFETQLEITRELSRKLVVALN